MRLARRCVWGGDSQLSGSNRTWTKYPDGTARCPGCGRTLKVTKHPASGAYDMLPRHNAPPKND